MQREISRTRQRCHCCHGNGYLPNVSNRMGGIGPGCCDVCYGDKEVDKVVYSMTCIKCNAGRVHRITTYPSGRRTVKDADCSICNGYGTITFTRYERI